MDKKIQVTRASMPPFDEFIDKIKPLWDSAWLTNMGSLHNEFNERLIKFMEVKNLSLFSNGHMALELLLQAMHLTGEVITTPFTFASTTHAIVRNNLQPVFCDIDPETYTISADKIEELITDKTSAILPVHIYGNICEVEIIDKIAKKYNLKVIYDAAHAFGCSLNGVGVGNFGDASMFSFHATKVFNSIEGGAITCNDMSLIDELYKLKNFGILSPTIVDGVGSNAKMNEFQAAMGICNLQHVNEEIKKRKRIVDMYNYYLSNINGIKLMKFIDNITTNYGYYPIVFEKDILGFDRDWVSLNLEKVNIYPRKYFYPLTCDYECYKTKYTSSNTPIAKYISQNVLTLPLYGDLEEEIVVKICKIIKTL